MIDKAKLIPGWMTDSELTWLSQAASKCSMIVEIGSWRGRSTRALADNSKAVIFCVDTWNDSAVGIPGWWSKSEDPKKYQQKGWLMKEFRDNLGDHIQNSRVVPLRMTSQEASIVLQYAVFDMIFIDADHTSAGLSQDIRLWNPMLKPSGVFCGHDYGDPYSPEVAPTIQRLIPSFDLCNTIWVARKPQPKVLISITSYLKGTLRGDNQAIRETYLQGFRRYPGLDYRFWIGDGTPTGEDETALEDSYNHKFSEPRYKQRALSTYQLKPEPFTYNPKPDEIILHVPDDYGHLSYKTRAAVRWAYEHDYDFVFQCCTDTFIDVERLLASGFEQYDYIGSRCGNEEMGGFYASGGSGYWLSKRAMKVLLNKPVTRWAEDWWVGNMLHDAGLNFHEDPRYPQWGGLGPQRDNNFITSHLCNCPQVYSPDMMREAQQTCFAPVQAKQTVTQSLYSPRMLRSNGCR